MIVKPDAVRKKNAVGDIIEQFEEKTAFRILAMKMLEISKHQAEQFLRRACQSSVFQYIDRLHVRAGRSWWLALEKENAIADLRKTHGAQPTPAQAEEGTIRKKWATNIEHNAISWLRRGKIRHASS